MNIRYLVELSAADKSMLQELTRKDKPPARKVKRAHILLMADGHEHNDAQIAQALSVGTATAYPTKRKLVEEGLNQSHSL